MKEIYTKAALTKCSKPKALEILEKFYTDMSEEDKQKNADDIASLFSFFTPKIKRKTNSKKQLSPSEWVNLAVSADKTRYYIATPYADGEYLVATDGNRLHRIVCSLKKGYRDSECNAIDIDGTFPDYRRLFFETEGKVEVTLDIDQAKLDKVGKVWFYVFDVMGTPYAFNKKYMDDALNGGRVLKGHIDVWDNNSDNVKDYILNKQYIDYPFQSEDKLIMLMPVRYNNK